jgi:hypothetical protein
MAETNSLTAKMAGRPLNRFSILDNDPVPLTVLAQVDPQQLARALNLSLAVAREILTIHRHQPVRGVVALLSVKELDTATRERVARLVHFADDPRIVILNVEPVDGRVMSDRPFAMRVTFATGVGSPPAMVSVRVEWAGEPFTVEQRLSAAEIDAGEIRVSFGERQTLPPGRATFRVSLYAITGAAALFRTTCAVLPSNPFSLDLAPRDNVVTGTFSARAVRSGANYVTAITLTFSNGDGGNVGVSQDINWTFWDGGVGAQIVESGVTHFNDPITVNGFSTWQGWIAFRSNCQMLWIGRA